MIPETPPPPLAGVKVLDLSRLLPGPYCTLILAHLGADVVKVEDLGGGDYLRRMPPRCGDTNGAFQLLNRGKRSLAIDLKRAEGRELLLRILPRFRVMVESFRPGVLDRLGLSFAEMTEVNSELVLCSMTGYGQTGPYRHRAGHDINFMALSGALAAGGGAGEAPAVPGVQVGDVAGGALWAAVRILAALRQPGGTHLDVSMTEGAMAMLLPWLGEHLLGAPPLRRGEGTLNGGSAVYGCYPTSDDGYLSVGALEPKFWYRLCGETGVTPRPEDPVADGRRRQEVREQMSAAFARRSRDRWAEELSGADCCTEPVLEMDELADHPLHRERGVFESVDHPTLGPVKMPRLPLDGPSPRRLAPDQGQHTDEVLVEAGLDREAIDQLRAAKVIA